MRFARVKRDDDALMLEIDFYAFYAGDFLQHRPQLAHAVIAIFAFGGNLNRLQNCVIGPFRIERVGGIRIAWSCRVHRFGFSLTNARQPRNGCLVRDLFERTPELLQCHPERSEGSLTRWRITQAQLCDQGSSVGSLACARDDCYLARDRFEHMPDGFGKNLLPGCVWMNSIGQIQRWIA
jgi:hypothetical protein